ncbi:MAG: hypothetical protein ACE5KD_00565 [Candidatus Bathyarchaeia archaeon]
MKKVALLIALVVFSLVLPIVFAAKNDIAVAGNETTANYTTQYISVSQLNSSIRSNQYVWYKATINISTNTSQAVQASAATLTDLNYTLGDEWANATGTAYIIIENATAADTTAISQPANNTYSDGTYLKAYFNLTGKGVVVTNTTNITWYITYRIAKPDDKKTVTTTYSDIHYTENVTYPGPSDLDVANVTIVYEPSQWAQWQSSTEISWNGTRVTDYSITANGVEYGTIDLLNDATNWLLVKYTIKGTGKGGTGAGATPPTGVIPTLPAVPTTIWIVVGLVISMIVAVLILLLLVYYYWK